MMFASHRVNPLSVRLSRCLLLMGIFLFSNAYSDIVTFTQPTHISAVNFSYDNNNIVIDGVQVTVDGEHEFVSLRIINGGVLTHSNEQKMDITVAGIVEIDAISRIDVSGKGLLGDSTAGYYTGGSHGGRGGDYSTNQSGASYGNYREPVSSGRGGRSAYSSSFTQGGGAIRIIADELILEGGILANGTSGGINYGGGAGGSIWLDVGTLRSETGTGEIRANGANGNGVGGGGGGGRVALYYQTMEGFSESSISASAGVRGSSGSKHGAPGTIYIKSSVGSDPAILIIKGIGDLAAEMVTNGSAADGLPVQITDEILQLDGASLSLSQNHTFFQLEIINNGTLTAATAVDDVNAGIILTAQKITIDETSRLDLSGRGLSGDVTAGLYTGGSHGGRGGDYGSSYQSGASYGNYREPVSSGRGGRSAYSSSFTQGGGAIRIIADELILEGGILANGTSGGINYGGGAGGSIWLDIGTLRSETGTGEIRANGANGNGVGGGGGGGRVALYYQTMEGFSESSISASAGMQGNSTSKHGAPGSLYIKQKLSADPARLLFYGVGDHDTRMSIDNILGSGDITAMEDILVIDHVTWLLEQNHEFLTIDIRDNSVVTINAANDLSNESIVLKASQITLDETSKVDVSAKGLSGDSTTGYYTGGSHGGRGGDYNTNLSGASYGNYREPVSSGRGGRSAYSSSFTQGGGAIRIIADELILEGGILANGASGSTNYGGGAGGSIWLDIGTLRSETGTGEIRANGANGNGAGGGGGGGRVALYYQTMEGFSASSISASAGMQGNSTAKHGAPGSLYIKQTSSADPARLLFYGAGDHDTRMSIDNILGSGDITAMEEILVINQVTWLLEKNHEFLTIDVRENSVITTHAANDSSGDNIVLKASKITLDATSKVDVSAKGLSGDSTTGYYTGGSHGGRGGDYNTNLSGASYGNYREPVSSGRGGRYTSNNFTQGGGAIRIIADELILEGGILANGTSGGINYGGGAGGSIWLDIGTLRSETGTGAIRANGANGNNSGGGGAGGRIAIYHELISGIPDGNITVTGGNRGANNTSATGNGEDGTIYTSLRRYLPYVYELNIPAFSPTIIDSIDLTFSIPMDASTISTADLVVINAMQQSIFPVNVTALNDKTFRFDFTSAFGEGSYTIHVGSDIFAQNGLQLDQNRNGTGGEPEDIFTFNFVVDLSEPVSVTVDVPLSPTVNKSTATAYVISGTREDNSAIWINGIQVVSLGSGNWTATITLPQGLSTLTVFAQDAAGNQSATIEVIVDVDSLLPVIQSISPSSGSSLAAAPNQIRINFSETGSGLDLDNSIFIVTKDGTPVAGTLELTNNQWFFDPQSPFTEGSYSVDVLLADKHGNISAPRTFTFAVDTTPPPAPTVNAYPALTSINTHTFSGTKEASSVLIWNGQAYSYPSGATNWSSTRALTFGDNTFTLTARDAAGNVSPPVVINIRYDDQAPGPVTPSVNTNGNGTELTLSWVNYSELENGNDIAVYRVYSALQNYSNIAQASLVQEVPAGTKTVKLTGLTRDQVYYLSVVAVDQQNLVNAAVTPVMATPQDTVAPADTTALQVQSTSNSLHLSWLPSADIDNDLASYRIRYTRNGEIQTILLNREDVGSANPVTHTLSNLSAATAHNVSVAVIDAKGNVSSGVTNPGVTWLANPANLQAEGFSGRAELSWSAVAPHNLLKHYAVYVQPANFTSVQGLTPAVIVAKGNAGQAMIARAITGLTDGVAVYVAVTAVNVSDGENPSVVAVEVIPQADTDGPDISEVRFNSNGSQWDFAQSPALSQSGTISIDASDKSAISRLVLTLDGDPLATLVTTSGGSYQQALDLSQYADRAHTLGISAYDTLDNVTSIDYEFTIDLAPPAAPVITTPAGHLTINQTSVSVSGSSLAGTRVRLFNNGQPVAENILPDSSGAFSATVMLIEGENSLTAQAQYTQRERWSDNSQVRIITVNTQIPNAPTGVTAVSAKQGQVLLGWNPVATGNANNQVKGYNIYRAVTAFTTKNDVVVQKVNSSLISTINYTDLVIADGDYFYAVTAVNQVDNESALSAVVQTKVDSTGPKAVAVTYDSNGNVDAATGRMAPAIIQVAVRFDEPLRNKPYFAIVPNGGLPLAIDLTKSFADDLLYQGQFQITDVTPSGTAYVVMSAYDNAGNRGTDVLDGATLLIDTDGPEVVELLLDPNDPLRVDAIHGLDISLSIRLNDELSAGQLPRLVPVLDGVIVAGYEQGVSLYQDTSATEGNPLWLGDFHLPITAGRNAQGQETVQNLSFAYAARDDLDNIATRIHGKNTFQVYQGDLPPLHVPTNLIARAQPGGQVALTWNAVPNAASYVLYRQGPGDSEPVALEPVTATTYLDETPVDGTYLYAIASVRSVNQQESLSARSDTVSVQTDRVPPGVPRNFVLELNGAGVVSRWEHPLVDAQGNAQISEGLTYNLYRLNLPEGQQVSDLNGLVPIQTKIPALIALDTLPSEIEHSYFVTAMDSAGNESAPGATVYLNFGLLPVNQLNIVLPENNFPQLSWQHNGQGISHYRVYRNIAGGEPELLTPQPIPHAGLTTTYIDRSYNNGQTTKGAHIPVSYTVVAVDGNEVESLGHSIDLPALSVSLPESADTLLQRGVMNRIVFRVDNKGSQALAGVRLYVAVTVEGVVKHHQSELFTVDAGVFTHVPVVIGGYAELSGIADLQLRLEQKPQVNESINIHQSHSLLVGNASLLPSLITENFTRGGSGVVSFTLKNTGDVETEIVMATNNGIANSNEVRLVLEDKQGNVLSVQPVKQYTGNVISIAGGLTIARIAPGQTFTSEPIHIPVPLASPDQVNLRLVIDKFHYHLGRDTHVEITGNGARRELMLGETSYTAEITSVSPAVIYGKGQSVAIGGRALNRADGQALANVPVTLAFTVRGFEKVVTTYTDNDGVFNYSFVSDGTSGIYTISAVHPDITERPNHGEFRVEGGSISPQTLTVNIPRNYTQKIPIKVTAGYDSALTNVRLVQIGVEEGFTAQLPLGVTVTHDALNTVEARKSGYLNIYFNGDNTANAAGLIRFRVEADNLVNEYALGEISLSYTLSEAAPALVAHPTHVDTGVGLEQQIFENLTLTNKGLDTLRNAQVSLTRPDGTAAPTWIVLATTSQLGNLAIGESRPVQLRISPGAEVTESNYEFRLRVTSDNMAIFTLPVFVAVTQSGQGNVFFHVSDIYTATLDENNQLIPGLQGARISLQNEQVLTETYDLTTTALGEAFFEGIPAGRYVYRASAFDHASVTGRVWVKPGVTAAEDVFLMNSLVNVEWSVREITIEDRYEIILEATFQTNVPVAVVMLSPLSVQLPVMKKGDLFHGELTLTNHGLIRAINVKQTLPQGSDAMRIEFLREVPEILEAREVVTLPYRIQALRDFNPQADANATGGNSCSVSAQTRVDYQSQCANGTVVSGGTSTNWNSNWSGCGTPNSGDYYYGGAGGFGGYTPAGSPIVGEEPLWCAVVTECEDGNCDNSSGK